MTTERPTYPEAEERIRKGAADLRVSSNDDTDLRETMRFAVVAAAVAAGMAGADAHAAFELGWPGPDPRVRRHTKGCKDHQRLDRAHTGCTCSCHQAGL